jgi:poly [ADP-ribose] polymerase 2/3/4
VPLFLMSSAREKREGKEERGLIPALINAEQFKDKTTHPWSSRTNPPKSGKYTYLERHYASDEGSLSSSDDEGAPTPGAGPSSAKKPKKEADTPPPISSLPSETQSLMSMIFSLNSLSSTLTSFEYDARKLPLGKLAKSTLEAGYTALREIADILNDQTGRLAQDRHGVGRGEALMMLSNRYYTTVPHAFGRNRPPVIGDKIRLKHELDLVDALGGELLPFLSLPLSFFRPRCSFGSGALEGC